MTYFFIGGSARSGTHLLESILSLDSAVNPPLAGAAYFHELVSAYHQGKRNFKLTADYFASFDEFHQFHSSWILNFLSNIKQQYPAAEHLILRWPYMATLFPTVHKLVPESKFVLIVRDPRDTIASMIKVAERKKDLPIKERSVANFNRNIIRLSSLYSSYYLPCLVKQSQSVDFREKLIWVQYESLVTNPDSIVAKLKKHTGLKFDRFDRDNIWQRRKPEFGQQDNLDAWFSPLYGKSISASHIGHYRKILTDEEIRAIENQCDFIFKLFAYQKHDLSCKVMSF
ncbi:sulfotransferase family protein [Baaleninema simplex]|uniref:sulfotransferase family protein n=1 Tax=Baaleninema simplex TaxID=2862350 RepID=UPI0003484344|nr:sulfotransferase [Baaleninema simplex]